MNSDASGLTPRLRTLLALRVSPRVAVGGSVGLVLLIAVGDFLSGPYLVWATFYIVPVVVTARFAGRNAGLGVAVLAAIAGAATTALDPREVTPPVIAWNAVFRFLTYGFIAVLVDAEQSAMQRIRALSATDPLTGLSNRLHFYELATLTLDRARRTGGPVAAIYVDVDDLKYRNDTYGHQAGDEMLVEFAVIARATFRSTDLLARLGGDEFCFLLEGADLPTAEEVVDRFVAALGQAPVLPIRVSVGLVAGTVDPSLNIEAVVHNADELMYQAKTAGKGQRCSRPSLGAADSTPEVIGRDP